MPVYSMFVEYKYFACMTVLKYDFLLKVDSSDRKVLKNET